jgi:hypothetical protein
MAKTSLYYEDDIQYHNQMLTTISECKTERVAPDYALSKSLETVDAIAELIKIKAMKQAQQILNEKGNDDEQAQ